MMTGVGIDVFLFDMQRVYGCSTCARQASAEGVET
jgi:hypothetical protein